MGKLISSLQVTGTFDLLSIYKMKGHDQPIVRKKGGPTREQIEKSGEFENTRRNIAEFAGRSAAVKSIRKVLGSQKALANFNFTGDLNKLLRFIQLSDKTNEWGKRSVQLSGQPSLLQGFNLNKTYPFDTVVRTPVSFELSKEQGTASLQLPALLPGINFFTNPLYSLYRFVATLGIVSDFEYAFGNKYVAINYGIDGSQCEVLSDWHACSKTSEKQTLQLSLPKFTVEDQSFTLMLSIGIAYGIMDDANHIMQAKYAGAAKVLGVA